MPANHEKCYWFNRWFTFVAAVFMLGLGGTPYLFEVYAPSIKSILGYTQTQITLVSTFSSFGSCASILIGVILDKTGPRPAGFISAISVGLGYAIMWLAVSGYISGFYLILCFAMGCIGFGSSGLYTAGIGPNIANFGEKNKGRVVGILAALYGLSGAMFTQIYIMFFKPDVLRFLLFLAISIAAIGFVATIFVNYVPKSAAKTIEEIQPLINDDVDDEFQDDVRNGSFKRRINEVIEQEEDPAFPQRTTLQMLKDLRFYLYIMAFITGASAGVLVISNIGSILLALGGLEGSQDHLVIVLSISNCAGRIVVGGVSDLLSNRINRPGFLIVVLGIMAFSQVWFSFSSLSMLYVGVALVGFSYGGICLLGPLIIHELWGAKHWGANVTIVGLGPAIGNYLVSVVLAGKLYEKHITDGGTMCYGNGCYRSTFVITAILCGCGILLASVLYGKTRKLYRWKREAALGLPRSERSSKIGRKSILVPAGKV